MFVALAYDEGIDIHETFMGIASTKKKAQEWIDNDYWICGNEKIPNHMEYAIREVEIDVPFN